MDQTMNPAATESLKERAARVRQAARVLAYQSSALKDDALRQVAHQLRAQADNIIQANREDMQRGTQKGLDAAFLDRLRLDVGRIEAMAAAVDEVVRLQDPVGRVERSWLRPNGLRVARQRIPLGVIGIIYESRPNVTSDAAALCLKSGNGVILKGGSDAFQSNRAIYQAIVDGLRASALPEEAHGAVGFIDTTDREAVGEMLRLEHEIDVIIPRGGHQLIRFVTENSRIPVIKHDQGVCHGVIEGSAPAELVDRVVLNAKTDRPGVCNAMETLLVLESAVDPHLERVLKLLSDAGVSLHLCERSMRAAQAAGIAPERYVRADEDAWRAEFLGMELAVGVVEDLTAAIAHIRTYGSNHSEMLLTQNYALSERFQREVDSSVVLINASTRFSDGNQLGLGAEIGISTSKMHAYGPMGIEELTTTRFVVLGDGQIRQS